MYFIHSSLRQALKYVLCIFLVTLLNIPGFIERLCKLATRKVTEAAGTSARLELEDWHSWLDNALVLNALMQLAIEEAEQSSTGMTVVVSVRSHLLLRCCPSKTLYLHIL